MMHFAVVKMQRTNTCSYVLLISTGVCSCACGGLAWSPTPQGHGWATAACAGVSKWGACKQGSLHSQSRRIWLKMTTSSCLRANEQHAWYDHRKGQVLGQHAAYDTMLPHTAL
ncbi:hypothetical protein COO60DRAFT_812641 [Scenedesmus sp. NREL 46B-D3]|nr:hypothetical protein COO60DRAFT_812641 [Scenedesmus sp. NREL 46B-D3]